MTSPQQKARGRRSRHLKFPLWLAAQVGRDDAIGHLAEKAFLDARRGGLADAASLARLNLVDTIDPSAREALFEAIVEWGALDDH